MEQTDTDKPQKFDPKLASELLFEIGRERSLDQLIRKLLDRLFQRRAPVARARFYLVAKGDICATCVRRPECPDQTRCLHAFAGRRRSTNSTDAVEEEALDAPERYVRVPLGVGTLGKIALTGQRVVLNDLDKDPGELAGIHWLEEEKIRGFHALPIVYNGEVLGILSVLLRANVPEDAKVWGGIFANHVAGVIANARAFDEIQKLKAELERQNAYLKEEVIEAKAFGDLVGESAALRLAVSQIDLVAPTEASVLILGETGTGKELVAHEIHRRSRRKDKPLVRVNCASIPKDLYESEFFGHSRGAFTGAIKERAGRFETAEGGTIFLDEIGEVPLDLQGKLLRVLQEKTYERVGEDRTRRADVRIIAATNRDLKAEAAAGRFRQDLYYRLNVFPIQIAPLRERGDDIPQLAQHFIRLSVKELGCAKPRLTRAGIIQLQSYAWPGNVRELRNVIERAVILARGGTLSFELPTAQTQPVVSSVKPHVENGAAAEFLTEAEMRRLERDNLVTALEKAGWKVKGPNGAAELLGINPATVTSRIRKLGLRRTPGAKGAHFGSSEKFLSGGFEELRG
jgi:transcriptional regulator with GAF, ATPase, and Fis domain